jgi:hypothetical protein
MARVYLYNHRSSKILYSVEKSVGRGGVNARDDVLLVQFFLRIAMEPYKVRPFYSVDGIGNEGFVPSDNKKPISIDGMYGSETLRYIKHYQEEGKRRSPGVRVPTDNKISPVVEGGSGFSDAITRLNWDYFDRRGMSLANDIRKDPLFPFDLHKSLAIN